MAQRIVLPNGDNLDFPDGMADKDIETAIQSEYPEYAQKQSLLSRVGSAAKAAAGGIIDQTRADIGFLRDPSVMKNDAVVERSNEFTPNQQNTDTAFKTAGVDQAALDSSIAQHKDRLRQLNPGAEESDLDALAYKAAIAKPAQPKAYDTRHRAAALKVAGASDGEASIDARFNQQLQHKLDQTQYTPEQGKVTQRMDEVREESYDKTSALDVAQASPGLALNAAKKGAVGAVETIASSQGLDELVGVAHDYRKELEAENQAITPHVRTGSLAADWLSATQSVMTSGVTIVAAAATAWRNPALSARLANIGLTEMGVQKFGERSTELLDKGYSPSSAIVHGLAGAITEVGPERLSLNKMLALFGKGAGEKIAKEALYKKIAQSMAVELGTEELTTIADFALQKWSDKPDMTGEDLMNQIKSTAISTMMATPIMMGGGAVANKAAQLASGGMAEQQFGRALNDSVNNTEFTHRGIDAGVIASMSPNPVQVPAGQIVPERGVLTRAANVAASMGVLPQQQDSALLADVQGLAYSEGEPHGATAEPGTGGLDTGSLPAGSDNPGGIHGNGVPVDGNGIPVADGTGQPGLAGPDAGSPGASGLAGSGVREGAVTPPLPGGQYLPKAPAPKAVAPVAEVPAEPKAFSIGTMPNNAEPITVKDGAIFIGKYPAQHFETGEDITVKPGASKAQIRDALKAAGAIGRGVKVFGIEKEAPKPKIKAKRIVDNTRDSLITAIGKLGGFHTDSVEASDIRTLLGVTGNMKIPVGSGLPVFLFNKNGKKPDDMAGALHEHGYLDEHDMNDMLDKLYNDKDQGSKYAEIQRGEEPEQEHEGARHGYDDLPEADQAAVSEVVAEAEDMLDDIPFLDIRTANKVTSKQFKTIEEEEEAIFGDINETTHEGTAAGTEGGHGETDARGAQGRGEDHPGQAPGESAGVDSPSQGFSLADQSESELAAKEARENDEKAAERARIKAESEALPGAFTLTSNEKPQALAESEGKANTGDMFSKPASQQAIKPASNTVFTEDAAAAARALLKKKLGQVNTGLDPEVMQAGITLAGYHIEKGARTFTAYAKAMIEDLGDVVKPYLKSWFLGVKFDPRAAAFSGEMDSAASVESADVDSLQANEQTGPLHIFRNEDTGMESHVVTGTNGRFNVVQKDTDSGEFTLEAKIFPTEEAAIAYAKTINPEPKTDVTETNFGNITEKLVNDKLETNLPEVEHVTKGGTGRTLQGVIAKTLTEKQARALDTGTFKKEGGWYIRMKYVVRPNSSQQFVGVNPDGKKIYQDERGVRFIFDSGFKIQESVGIIPGGGIEIRNRKDEYKTVDELAQDKPKQSANENANVYFEEGKYAFNNRLPRIPPSHFNGGTEGAKDWYRGWDAANIAEPVDSATLKSGPTNGDDHANPIQAESVPAGSAGEDQADAATGNRDRQPLGAGLAGGREGAGGSGSVSGSPAKPGGTGAGSVEQSGEQSPGTTRDRPGVRPEPKPADDFVIDAEEIGKGGLTKKYRDNITAIKIIKAMEEENRVATPDERKLIAKYAGWGALKGAFDPANKQWAKQHEELKGLLTDAEFKAARASTLDAHYTSPDVVKAMYSGMERMGFTGGRVLEPSVGVGNFFGLMPAALRNASNLIGVELDSLTARLVTALYPKAKISHTGFEDFQMPAEYADAVVGNPPFGSSPIVDSERSPYSGFSIHNYFLAKAIDKLRPGGIMQVVVSHNFLDAQDNRARKWIAERANLIGVARLPNTAFKENAGTEVVTDIVIFQKKQSSEPATSAHWVDVADQVNHNPKTGEAVTHKVNKFLISYPANILGTTSAAGSMYSANEYTVEASGNLKDQLAAWVSTLPKEIFKAIDRKSDKAIIDMAIPDGIKPGSYYMDATGKIMQRGNDVMGNKTANPWTPPNEKAASRMAGMIGLRDSLRKQMRLERSVDAAAGDIDLNRKRLNNQYDTFLKQFGHVNSQVNRKIFLDDTESHLIQGLEFDFDKGISKAVADKEELDPRDPSATKADIFSQRVAFPPQDFITVTTAKDALLASLNYRGKVDQAYMTEVYHKPADEIIEELGDVVFDDPQSGIVTADEYLSGDVKTKLVEAQAAALDNPKYKRNVEALEPVIPADKKPSEISAAIGAAFVPAEIYEQFIQQISGGTATASYVKATGQWLISFHGSADAALNTGKFGTSHLSAQELFQLSMLGRGAVVKKTIRNGDGSTTTILLEKETEAAREKQNAIKAEWQKWLWSDPARAERVASIFNDKMNRIVERKFDGGHMTFPGMNPAITLLDHQKNGVWRGLQSYQVLYDHVVGAGKTFEMAALAMEMRRMGIARKPLFAVPNHLTLQWRSEFTRLYPGSNVLAATPEDFSKGNRERMFAKIITGDWDAVVIGHSSLKKIGLPEATERAVLQEQLDEISEAIEEMKRGRGDRNIISDMEKIRKNLEAKMKEKLANIGQRDKMVTFDELGVDAMFIDEMHEFKNLTYHSTMDRNPGMGNPAGSAKAFDMFVKTRWLFDTFGAKTPFISATGTPVSNSLVEMYNMQRYMQYPTLKKAGLHVFDAWAKQFGSVENVYEVSPSGSGYRQSTRFAKFTNLTGLMGMYNTFADTVTLDDLKAQEEAQGKRFPVPKMKGGRPEIVVAKRLPMVAEKMGVPRAELDESGNIKFDLQADQAPTIEQNKETGKWHAKATQINSEGIEYLIDVGQFDTEEDARLKIVERALSPVVTVDPESILGRFANLRQLTRETKGKVNALSLTGEANKLGLDYRLIDPSAPDFAGSKINLAVANMVEVYRQWDADKGTQLVFCDMSIPLSARATFGATARRLYVRDEYHELDMKRGTMHTLEGHEDLPYFVVQRGEKDTKRFDAYDAVSGGKLFGDMRTKQEARDKANEILANTDKRQIWIENREQLGEISQEQIDEYNNENEVETEGFEFFSREDVAGMSGSAKFSVYDDIKAKLIKQGIPEREIAFIHDYSTPTAKDKLFKAVNNGSIRFLLGSTPKMGAGTNVQQRLVGLHHIDAPWRPSDLEQREGRIIRRDNKLYNRDPDGFEIYIGRYATEQTYDTRRWQILEHKARGIEQLRNFDGSINEIDDIEGEAANSADMKAAASGDPLILDETKLRNDVRRLEQLQAGHADEVVAMARKSKAAQEYADIYGPRHVSELQTLLDEIKKHPLNKEGFAPITVNTSKFSDKEKAIKEIDSVAGLVRSGLRESATIIYRGIEFRLSAPHANIMVLDSPTGGVGTWSGSELFSASGFVQRLANYAGRLPAALEDSKTKIEKSAQDAAAMVEQSKQPFAQAADLEHARDEHKKVQRALMAKGPAVPEEQKAAVAAGIEAQKAKLVKMGYGDALNEFSGAKFSRGNAQQGQPKADVEALAKKITGHWNNPPKITVAQSIDDLPQGLRDQVYAKGAEGDMEGVYLTGSKHVYLVADHLPTPQRALFVLIHEAIGHHGLRGVFGDGIKPVMMQIYQTNASVRTKADELVKEYGYDKALATEEVLADMPGEGAIEQLNGWKRIVAYIMGKLRQWGITDKWTDSDVISLLAKAGRHVIDGEGNLAMGGDQTALASRGDTSTTKAAWKILSGDMAMFQNPTPDSFEMEQGAREIDPGMKAAEDKPDLDEEKAGIVRKWYVTMPDKTHAWIRENKKGEVWLDASDLAEGVSGGTKLYLLVGNYAEANGKVFIGDPAGLSDVALIRRTENMLSLALRFGSTKFLEPHEFQMNPGAKLDTALDGVARPITWITGDDENNLNELLKTSYDNTINLVPGIKNVTYNFDKQRFEQDGNEFDDANFKELRDSIPDSLRERGLSKLNTRRNPGGEGGKAKEFSPFGIATLKRTALTNTFSRAASEGRGRSLLDEIGRIVPGGLKGTPLQGILYSRQQQIPGITIPEETKSQAAQRVVQDKFNRFKVLQDWVKSQGMDLSEAADVYLAETLMSGRISTRKQDFRENQMGPLIQKTQSAGIGMEQVGEFLKIQHAPEANKRAREIHHDQDATAYGVTDQDAADGMDEFKRMPNFAEIKAISNEWRSITGQTKQILLDAGILSEEMAQAWDNTYSQYVPVKGMEDQPGNGTGKGLNVNGRQKKRLGHELRDEGIIENILRDHERAISLDEKNLVGKALIRFALVAKNPDIITVSQPVKRQVLKEGQAHYMVTHHGADIAGFDNLNDARRHLADESLKVGGDKRDFDIAKTSDPVRVMLQASPMLADNEVNVYVAGHAIRVQINDEIAARAYTSLGVEHLNAVLSAGRAVNTWLSKAYTGYSPDFIFTNPIRDAIQGAITLTGNYGAGMAAKIFSNYPLAVKELAKHFRKPGSSTIVTDYRANGGSTGAAYLSDLERIGDDIQASYNEYAGMINTYQRTYAKAIEEGKGVAKANSLAILKSGVSGFKNIPVIGHFLSLMEHINALTENALRVATYHALVKEGVSKSRAAEQAKNLMNFNRKGEISNQAGALYLFFNPNVQGSQVIYRALVESEHKGQARALAGTMVLSAMALAALACGGGDDDKEKWNNTPDYVKDGNLVIGYGDYQITLPLPYGYRVFHTLGNVMFDYAQGIDGHKLGIRLASSVFSNFSPVGNPTEGEHGLFQIMPTIPKMILGPGVNEDSFGRAITPKRFNEAKPDSQMMNRTSKGTLYASTAEGLNALTGGTKYEKGAIDVSPETLKYWVKSVTGGAGQFAMDAIHIPTMAAQGVAPQSPRDIPIARRFVRETGVSDSRSAFWERANEAKKAADAFGEARKNRDSAAVNDILKENKPLIELSHYAENQQRMAKAKRDEIDRIKNDDNLSLLQKTNKMKLIENEESAIYTRFIRQFDKKMAATKAASK